MDAGALRYRTREALFVGRGDYLSAFRRLLQRRDTPRVLYVSGPGGIGKTCLLEAFRRTAAELGCPFCYLDARRLAADPEVIRPVVMQALAPERERSGAPRSRVLAVDHVECWSSVVGWLRASLLPRLPESAVLVIARRARPGADWWADPGVHSLITEHALGPLDDTDAADYLTRRGLSAKQQPAVLDYAQGYPLALAMAASRVLCVPGHAFRPHYPELNGGEALWLDRGLSDPPAPISANDAEIRPAIDENGIRSAVTEALRDYHDPARLARNPLLDSRLLHHQSRSVRPGPEELRQLLRQVCHNHLNITLRSLPAPVRILSLAYFEPLGKQFAAAEALNVSVRTFRRYLRDAERRLADILWLMESGRWQPEQDATS